MRIIFCGYIATIDSVYVCIYTVEYYEYIHVPVLYINFGGAVQGTPPGHAISSALTESLCAEWEHCFVHASSLASYNALVLPRQ